MEVEHVLSESVLSSLRTVAAGLRHPRNTRPVLLAAAEQEQHGLPLQVLTASLAEHGVASRLLGVRVPRTALAAAVRRSGPAVVFVYAHLKVREPEQLDDLPRLRPSPLLLLGGPGLARRRHPSGRRAGGTTSPRPRTGSRRPSAPERIGGSRKPARQGSTAPFPPADRQSEHRPGAGEEVRAVATVLVVDDTPIVREQLRRAVAGLPGITRVVGAASGEEALSRWPVERPSVVLLDVRMPGIGGVEAAKRLLTRHPEANVLMTTMAEDADGLARAVAAGARGYVVKDASPEELSIALAAALSEAARRQVPGADPRPRRARPSP